MQLQQVWNHVIPDPSRPNAVKAIAFHPSGEVVFVAIAGVVVTYNCRDGSMAFKPLKAASETVTTLAINKDGTMLASGASDRTTVVFIINVENPNSLIEPILRFQLGDSITAMDFSPLTLHLFVASANDFATYMPNKTGISKERSSQKIISCAWSPDGMLLALGTMEGAVVFKDKNLVTKLQCRRSVPAWCMAWTPFSGEHQQVLLLVGYWDQSLVYLNRDCQQVLQKRISFDPLSINFFSTGQFFLVSGNNRAINIYTRQLYNLDQVHTSSDWAWACGFVPRSTQLDLLVTTNDGHINCLRQPRERIHDYHDSLYCFRENLTQVRIDNLLTGQSLKIRCKELVVRVAIYKDKVLALQRERAIIYVSYEDSLKFKPFKKISKRIPADHIALTSMHIVAAKGKKVSLYDFFGTVEREWVLTSPTTCLRVVGGPPRMEGILIGTEDGQVLKVFADNSFPIVLHNAGSRIRFADLNCSRKRLAVIDWNKNLLVIDLASQTQLFAQTKVDSCAWSADLEDAIGYAGDTFISFRVGSFPAVTQPSSSLQLVGFKGLKLFCLKDRQINSIDISLSSALQKYLEKKDFAASYRIATLSIPDDEVRMIGTEAMLAGQFSVAMRCFQRIKDLPYIELCRQAEKDKASSPDLLRAEICCYESRYQDAAAIYQKVGQPQRAVQLFCDLRRWDEAKKYGKGSKEVDFSQIVMNEANQARAIGDTKRASSLYLSIKAYRKAIEMLIEKEEEDGILQICRLIDKDENAEELRLCGQYFKGKQLHSQAKEAYLKLGDPKQLIQLHVALEKWEEAFLMARQHLIYADLVRLPYAQWLLKEDRFEEALRAFKSMGRTDLTLSMYSSLAQNSLEQGSFQEASQYFHEVGVERLRHVSNLRSPEPEEMRLLQAYESCRTKSEVYCAYSKIVRFVESPFCSNSQSILFEIINDGRFVLAHAPAHVPYVDLAYVYFAMAKVSQLLHGYKTARICLERLSGIVVPSHWEEEVQLSHLLLKSKPMVDNDKMLPCCPRCQSPNPVVQERNCCYACKYPFVVSLVSFQVLPLLEFKLESKLTHARFLDLIEVEKPIRRKEEGKADRSPFTVRLQQNVDQQQLSEEYVALLLGEEEVKTFSAEDVLVLDQRKLHGGLQIRYFKNQQPDLLLKVCEICLKVFLLDEFEFQFIQSGKCPFCKSMDRRVRQKDPFDL